MRITYDLSGIVQGVGFRPTVYRLARQLNLGGYVLNRSGTVRIGLCGPAEAIDLFYRELPQHLPPRARITERQLVPNDPEPIDDSVFRIADSRDDQAVAISIPADLGMCEYCREEVFDPDNRRYGYPFTTCTLCGPRYTVLRDMPYDRERTSLADFPLCEACRREYENPEDRRFHAESTACADCGPSLTFLPANGTALPLLDPLRHARRQLAEGAVLAVRGIGGFLLAVDALNREAVERLRDRKQRPHKPFAVMARNLETARQYVHLHPEEQKALTSPSAPIVIADVRRPAGNAWPLDLLTPDTSTLGLFLPTTPLHALLFEPLPGDSIPPFDLLVMTSGNRRGEPIALNDEEAVEALQGIADGFLTHNRAIERRCDDSLVRLQHGRMQLWRRARGYAPDTLKLNAPLSRTALAMGADMKNAVALGYEDAIAASPHIGDLETPAAVDACRETITALPAFLERAPETIAVDLHPDMHSTRLGRETARLHDIPVVAIQHHHAHAAACMAEHGLDECLALVLDGTGWGPDGVIWGSELLHCRGTSARRLACFQPSPLPGGDAAVRQPSRQLVARLHQAGVRPDASFWARYGIDPAHAEIWGQQCEQALNAPLSGGAGRLFDAVSAGLGISCDPITYDGQPAIRLEGAAAGARPFDWPAPLFECRTPSSGLRIHWDGLFRQLADPGFPFEHAAGLARSFHLSVAVAARRMILYGMDRADCRDIVLSGGVFMNRLLTDALAVMVDDSGARVVCHEQTPPNDACIAIGQAWLAGRCDPSEAGPELIP